MIGEGMNGFPHKIYEKGKRKNNRERGGTGGKKGKIGKNVVNFYVISIHARASHLDFFKRGKR